MKKYILCVLSLLTVSMGYAGVNLTPITNGDGSLGTPTKGWASVYSTTGSFVGYVYIGSMTVYGTITSSSGFRGDGSQLSGISVGGGSSFSGNVATSTLNMNDNQIINITSMNVYGTITSTSGFVGDGTKLTGITAVTAQSLPLISLSTTYVQNSDLLQQTSFYVLTSTTAGQSVSSNTIVRGLLGVGNYMPRGMLDLYYTGTQNPAPVAYIGTSDTVNNGIYFGAGTSKITGGNSTIQLLYSGSSGLTVNSTGLSSTGGTLALGTVSSLVRGGSGALTIQTNASDLNLSPIGIVNITTSAMVIGTFTVSSNMEASSGTFHGNILSTGIATLTTVQTSSITALNVGAMYFSGFPMWFNAAAVGSDSGGGQDFAQFAVSNTNPRYFVNRNMNGAGYSISRWEADGTNVSKMDMGLLGTTNTGKNGYDNTGFIALTSMRGFGIYNNGGPVSNISLIPTIYFSSGMVGVNMSTPTAYFEVHSTSPYLGAMNCVVDFSSSNGTSYFSVGQDSTTVWNQLRIQAKAGADAGLTLPLLDVSTGTSRLFEVYRTSINCGVPLFQNTPFADYVFDQDHYLPTIDNAEEMVHKENHLPNFPPGTELNTKSDGEKYSKLLAKLEEAYLYIFELNNRLKKLEHPQPELITGDGRIPHYGEINNHVK